MRPSDHALNRLHVLKAIRRWGPIARIDLARRTGISGGSITQLTAELLDKGLIVERKDAAGRPGRPRTHLEINANGALVIGSSIVDGCLSVTFIDLAGSRRHAVELPLVAEHSLAARATAIGETLAAAIASSPFEPGEISRVGIALPAVVDSVRGNVHFMVTYPASGPVSFAVPIAARLGLPVTIENDVACMARAEHWFGRARDLATFTLVDVGFAIGSATYVDGLPRAGANGLNAELGHIKSVVGEGARGCYCGGQGCLSAYASMFGVLDTLMDGPFPLIGGLTAQFARYMDRAEAGDPGARAALAEAGTRLGVALANLITATDPGNLLVTFQSARFLDAIRAPLQQALEASAMPAVLAATTIEFLLTDEEWRWHGTAALALEQAYLGSG